MINTFDGDKNGIAIKLWIIGCPLGKPNPFTYESSCGDFEIIIFFSDIEVPFLIKIYVMKYNNTSKRFRIINFLITFFTL